MSDMPKEIWLRDNTVAFCGAPSYETFGRTEHYYTNEPDFSNRIKYIRADLVQQLVNALEFYAHGDWDSRWDAYNLNFTDSNPVIEEGKRARKALEGMK